MNLSERRLNHSCQNEFVPSSADWNYRGPLGTSIPAHTEAAAEFVATAEVVLCCALVTEPSGSAADKEPRVERRAL